MRARRSGFALQVYVMQVVLITVVAVVFTALAIGEQVDRVRHDNAQQIRASALTGSTLPSVVDGLRSPDPTAQIQPVVKAMREATGVDYVTVVDMAGVRVAHTNPRLIGEPVSSDHGVVRSGGEFVGVETGPSGRTFRVKEPVRAADGTIVGTLSLGIAEERLTVDVVDRAMELVYVAAAAVILGSALSWVVTRAVQRRLHGVDPAEIPTLLRTRDSVLEGIGDGLVILDAEDRIVLANIAAGELLGGRNLEGLHARDALPPNLVDLLDAADEHEVERPRAEDLAIGGHRVAVTAWQSRLEGRQVGTTLLLQDRTDLMLALDELRSQKSRVQSMRRETHEFDNRLHVIGGLLSLGRHEEAAQLLAERTGKPGPGDDADLRVLEAIEDPVLAALVHSLTHRARARGLTIDVTEDSAVEGPTDPAATTVVGNLVTNALETARTQVRVYLCGDEEGLALLVEDDGPGVPDAVRDTLFEEGVTTKPSGRAGRGIGLHLVRTLVASRGGEITVGDSDLGGASFTVEIPAAAPPDPHPALPSGTGSVARREEVTA